MLFTAHAIFTAKNKRDKKEKKSKLTQRKKYKHPPYRPEINSKCLKKNDKYPYWPCIYIGKDFNKLKGDYCLMFSGCGGEPVAETCFFSHLAPYDVKMALNSCGKKTAKNLALVEAIKEFDEYYEKTFGRSNLVTPNEDVRRDSDDETLQDDD